MVMQMKPLGEIVRYREGSHHYIALVTSVVDDEHGIVNLSVFPADGGCVGRTGIPPGDKPGCWRPLHEMFGAELDAGANALTTLVAEKLDALVKRVVDLEVHLAQPARLPDQPSSVEPA
jgi:hypothetical protein